MKSKNGRTQTVEDREHNITTYEYSNRGLVTKITQFITEGEVMRPITTSYSYDTHGNLIESRDALGNSTYYAYDQTGNPLITGDALGNASTYEYDGYGRLTSSTNSSGHTVTRTYDDFGMGNLEETSSVRNIDGVNVTVTHTNEYDALGRLVKSIDSEGNETITEHNSIGKKLYTIDKLGRRTDYTYDARGNLTFFTSGSRSMVCLRS